jgi:tRNA-specific 2-thiouridylase
VAMSADGLDVRWHEPQRRVAPGQSVVLYDPSDTYVLGGGVAT